MSALSFRTSSSAIRSSLLSAACRASARSRAASASCSSISSGAARVALPPVVQRFERFELFRRERPFDAMHHAQRPERVPIGRHQRRARIEPYVRLARHERIVSQPIVLLRFGDDDQSALLDGVGAAEGHRTGDLRDRETDPRFEPLPIGIDQADERDWRAADLRGDNDEIIERALRLRVEMRYRSSAARRAVSSTGCAAIVQLGRIIAPAQGS
jgi:hypothetical protein